MALRIILAFSRKMSDHLKMTKKKGLSLVVLIAVLTISVWTLRPSEKKELANFQASRAPQSQNGLVAGAVIYGLVPALFGPKPFQAVTKKMDDFQKLGADVLWLSPVNSTDDPSLISYSVTDFFNLRPDLGTPAEFKALVQEAHKRGMKVIMDFVPNHTSSGHPYYVDTLKRGKDSPYFDYYQRDENGNAKYYFDWKHLPNLNYNHPEVRKMITNAFQHWIREYDIDGFRVDVAWGVKERAPDFWALLVKDLLVLKPELIMLAEAGARDPYYFRNGFDLAYDWTDELGKWAWEKAFTDRKKISHHLHQALTSSPAPSHRVARFLNNNDTGKRFITKYGPELTKVAAVLQHTVPGVPIVYTGDEIGAEFEPYEDPPPISQKDPHKLQALYQKLSLLREQLPALQGNQWMPIVPQPSDRDHYAYFRSADGHQTVLVVLNFGNAKTVEFEVPAAYRKFFKANEIQDVLSGEDQTIIRSETGDRLQLKMKARKAFIFIL